jgi:hypothetical protein
LGTFYDFDDWTSSSIFTYWRKLLQRVAMTLRRSGGWVVAYFRSRGATEEAIEQVAWQDQEGSGEEEYP